MTAQRIARELRLRGHRAARPSAFLASVLSVLGAALGLGLALFGAPPAKGMLAEYVTLPEAGLVPLAETLSFEEAATLPCAGV